MFEGLTGGSTETEEKPKKTTRKKTATKTTTNRKFRKLVNKPLSFCGVDIAKDVLEFEVTEKQLSNARALKKLENAIGKTIEEIK